MLLAKLWLMQVQNFNIKFVQIYLGHPLGALFLYQHLHSY